MGVGPVDHHDFVAVVGARTTAWRRVAFLICGDWAAAEDVVQAALLKLAQSWHRIEPAGLEAYARKVISRVAIDESRKPHHRAERLIEPPDQSSPDRPAEDILDVRAALNLLSARQRAVLVFRFYDDLTIAETAKALGLTQSTVKSYTARGLDALRCSLNKAGLDVVESNDREPRPSQPEAKR